MIIKRIKLENYTVFEDHQTEFDPGINIFIGENGTGKTHLFKVLYSACQCVDQRVSFSHKLVSTMLPDDYKISRLITRKQGNRSALIRIFAGERDVTQERVLSASFHGKTKKWDAEVTGEKGWDEPESNINPSYISIIVELLLELQRKGVQVFVSTHDYMIASYFEVRKAKNDSIAFHSLSHVGKTCDLIYEKKEQFADLKNNAIVSAFDKLLDEIYDL